MKFKLITLCFILGLFISAVTYADIPNGIYTVDNGNISIIYHDDVRGNIEYTIASGDLAGGYYYGFNENTERSSRIGNRQEIGCIEPYRDGPVMCGRTTDCSSNLRGGGLDNKNNLYNPNPTNYIERKGPCPEGWHIPSKGERNMLAIAWCNIDKECNPDIDIHRINNIDQYFYKSRTGINRLLDVFNMNYNNYYATSTKWFSVDSDYDKFILGLSCSTPLGDTTCMLANNVRCFKNTITIPNIFDVKFFDSDVLIGNSSIVSGNNIPTEIIIQHNLTGLTKTGYTFSGWIISGSNDVFDVENDIITTGMTLNAVWEIINYEIDYKLDGGINNENNVTGYTIETESITLSDPTKEGHNFSGWFLDTGFTNQITEITKGSTGDITLYAKWTKIETKPSGGSSGGGGRSSKTLDIQDSSTSSQNDNKSSSGTDVKDLRGDIKDSSDKSSEGQSQQQFTQEFQEAYEFAHEKGITTMPTIQEAQMDGKLTRIAMAKMLSQYAMNVLGQKPANIVTPKFSDVTDKQNSDYDDGVTLAYQLGIMGQNMPNNNFRPNDEVTRAEFATALSRMLYHTPDGEYKSTDKYYTNHMKKLVQEKIITNDDAKMKELRGYVMIMLMRSTK